MRMYAVFFKKDNEGKIFDSYTLERRGKKPISEEDCIKFINKPNVIYFGKNVEGSLVYGVWP